MVSFLALVRRGAVASGVACFIVSSAVQLSAQIASVPYFNDFEGAVGPEWANPLIERGDPWRFSRFLGRSGGPQTLTVGGLTAGESYTVAFDLYIIDTWDGGNTNSGDVFFVQVNGTNVFRHSFANYGGTQTFPRNPDEGRESLGFNTGNNWVDAIYRAVETTFVATGEVATIVFNGANLEVVDNESWGIDNVSVQPTPATTNTFLRSTSLPPHNSTNAVAISQFGVFANQPLAAVTATNAANWSLREAGGNAEFGDGDDTVINLTVALAPTFNTGRSMLFTVANGPLQPGRYRFQSGTNLTDTNGVAVPVFTRDFALAAPVLGAMENTANDTIALATSLPLTESPAGAGFLTALGIGDFSTVGGVDYWRFDAVAGDRLTARIEMAGDGTYPRLYLQDVAGANLTTVNGNYQGVATIQQYGFSTPGTYYLRVWTDSRPAPYQLRVDLARGIQLESEANDSIGAANTISFSATPGVAQGRIAGALPSDDPTGDYYVLTTLNPGNSVSVVARFPDGSTLDAGRLILELWAAGNTNVLATNTGNTLNYTVTTSAAYYVRAWTPIRAIRHQYVLDFALGDGVPPAVVSTSLPDDGAASGAVLDRFSLGFSENLQVAPVTSSASYELRGAGLDETLDTADDALYTVVSDAAYAGGLANNYIISDGPLQPGLVRLTVRTNLLDRVGNNMAAPFVRTFTITNVPGYVLEPRGNQVPGSGGFLIPSPSANSDGTFAFYRTWSTGSQPHYLAGGDLNGDGAMDLIVPNYNSQTVTLTTNDGRGNFQTLTNLTGFSGPVAIAAGRFNADTNLDFAVANYSGNSIAIVLATNNGFVLFTNLSGGFNTPYQLAAADLNGDGFLDLAVPNYNGSNVRVLLGRGDGTFGTGTNYSTPANPRQVVIGDLNGDTIPDLAVANNSGTVSVLLGNGTGFFQTATNLPAGGTTRSVAIGDVTGDGTNDLVSISIGETTLSVFRGNGNGTFQPRVTFASGAGDAYQLTLGDLNGDGSLDAVIPTYEYYGPIAVLLNNGSGVFTNRVTYDLEGNAYALGAVIADFNGDGRKDLAFTRYGSGGFSLFFGNPLSTLLEDPPGSGLRSGFARGNITDNSDVDYYRFTGTAGDLAIVAIETPGAPGDSGLRVNLLRADGGNLTEYYPNNTGWGQSATVTLPYTGTYLVVVQRWHDYRGEYRLRVSTARPPLRFEAEDNNSIGNATVPVLVPTNGHLQGTIAGYVSRGDSAGDYYNLGILLAGATVNLNVTQPASSGIAAILTVHNAAGQVVANSAAGATNLTVTIPADGTYYARFTADPLPPAQNIGGQPGYALLCSGSGDYVRIPDNPALRPVNFTVEGWFNFASTGSGQHLLAKTYGGGDDDSYVVWYENGSLRGYVTSGPQLQFPWSPEIGRWYHIAYVFDDAANTHTLYVDGQPAASGTVNSSPSYDTHPLLLGAEIRNEAPAGFFSGKIDEFRLWNVARASNEIATARSQRLNGNEAGLVGYWRLDEGTGTTTADATANGNTGTLVGNPVWAASTLSATRPMALAAQYLLGFDLTESAPLAITANTLPANGAVVSNIIQSFTLTFNKELDPRINNINRVVNGYGTNRYLLTDTATSWIEAEAFAVSVGGHLATVNDAAENDWLRQAFSGGGNFWIGLNDRAAEGAFQWVSGQPFTYTNWLVNKPDNAGGAYGVYLATSTGQWGDSASTSLRGIVEMPGLPDADNDGLPDSVDTFPADFRNAIELRAAGPDGNFDTADDVLYNLDTTTYTRGPTLSLNVVDGPLQAGLYRLTVTPALTDRMGNGLSTTYTRTFTIAPWTGFVLESRNNGSTILATSLSPGTTAAMSGGFALGTNYLTGDIPHYLLVTNLNSDTNLDVIVANYNSATLGIYLGNPNGTFLLLTNHSTPSGPIGMAVADFNKDGQLDVAVAHYSANSLGIRLGNGTGVFNAFTNYATPANPYYMVAADFNKDGNPDAATANITGDNISIFLGNGDGTFQPRTDIATGDGAYQIATADLNADTNPDLLVVNRYARTLTVLLGNGNGTFQTRTNYTMSDTGGALGVADLDDDTQPDVVMVCYNTLYFFRGNGDGTFAPPGTLDIGTSDTYDMALVDIDGNGTRDVVLADYGRSTVVTVANLGNGSFGSALTYGMDGRVISVGTGDFNHDGRLDLALANYTADTLQIMFGVGSQPLAFDAVTGLRNGAGRGALFSSSDEDYWTFTANANDRFVLASETLATPSASRNRFLIYRPDGSQMADVYHDYNNGTLTYSTILGAAGTYVIRVLNSDQYRGEYRFRVTLAPPPLQYESEDNNSIANADSLTLTLDAGKQTAAAFGYIGQYDPADFYRLGNLSEGTAITLKPSRPATSGMVPWVSLYNAAGALVTNAAPGADLNYVIGPGGSGAYFARVQQSYNLPLGGATNALSFDGSNDYINLGAWTPGTRWSVQAWVQPQGYLSGRHTIAGGFGGCMDWGIVMSDGRFGVATRPPGGCSVTYAAPDFPVLGAWYHVAASCDGTNAYLYVNGVLAASGPVEVNYSPYAGGTWIGGEICCGGNNFPGLIQEVSVWNRPLTQAEIAGIMVTNLTGAETNLLGYWRLKEGTGTTVADASPQNRTGTLVNGPQWISQFAPNALGPGVLSEYRLDVELIDTQPPFITGTTLPAEGTATSAIIDRFAMGVSEDMNPTNLADSANYELRNAGPDGLFGTADDSFYTVVNSPAYTSGTNASYLITDGPLQAGNYRFTVSSNLTDTSGSRLNPVYVQSFSITNVPGFILENRSNGAANLATSLSVARTNRPSGNLLRANTYPLPLNPEYVAAGLLDGDTNLDLVIPIYGNSTISVYTGQGDGTFQLRTNFTGSAGGLTPVLVNLNGDAYLDLVVGDYTADTVSVYLGNGDATFSKLTNYAVGDRPYGMVSADFNGDGRADIAVANYGSSTLNVLMGDGDGHFQAPSTNLTGASPYSLAVGDVNGDGWPDLVSANYATDNLSLFLNNGNGTFAPAVQIAVNNGPRAVAVADLNGDGRLDLISGNQDSTFSVLWGNGNGTFQPRVNFSSGLNNTYYVLAADMNNDGRLDLVGTGYDNDRVGVLLNAGGGQFQSAMTFATGDGPLGFVAGDYNTDGRPDLVVVNNINSGSGNNFQVFLGADSEPLAPDGLGGLVFSSQARGNLFDNSDYDYWSFTAEAGDRVQVAMEIPGNPSGSGLVAYLFRPDGAQLTYFYTDYYGRGTVTATLPISGTYTVRVSYNYSYRGEYRLRTSVIKPPVQVESEGNDSTGAANSLSFPTVFGQRSARVFGSFSTDDSQDFYRLGNLSAGTTISLSFQRPTSSLLSAALAIYKGGTMVTSAPVDVTNLVYTIPTGGEDAYYARISVANSTAGLFSHYALNLDLSDNTTPRILATSLPANGSTSYDVIDRFSVSFNKDLDPSAGQLGQNVRLRNGHAYLLSSGSQSWLAAENEAVARGGHLVTINDAAENEWLAATFGDSRWIGFTDEASEGNWVWVSGEPVTYTSWNSGEPNNSGNEDYGMIYSNGKWNDAPLSSSMQGIIEVAGADADGDGLPDSVDPFPADPFNLYDLRAAGPDGQFDTPDDEVYKLTPSSYTSGLSLSLYALNGPLQPGQYRFRVTTSLRDTFGNSATAPFDQFFTVANLPRYTFENRTNDTAATATPLALQENPTGVKTALARGKRYDSSDVDYWSFSANAGDTLLLAVEIPGNPGGSSLRYEVYNPAGTRILDYSPDYYGSGQAAPVALTTNGLYLVRVSNNYSYLNEYRFRATIASPPIVVEVEANNTIATATTLPLADSGESRIGSALGSANSATDLDYFNLGVLTNGSSVFLSARLPDGSTYAPAVGVYNASGQYLGEVNSGSSGDGVAEVRILTTGTYYALVRGTTPAADLQAVYVLDVQVVPTGAVSFPNLIVTTVSLPGGTPLSGQPVNFSYSVANTGSLATVVASWLDRAAFSTNTILGDGDDIPLGFTPHFGSLEPGQGYTVTNALTLPDGVSGDYYLIVQTDSGNAVNEFVFEADNIYVSSTTFHVTRAPYPDLKIEGLALAGPDTNGTYTINWTTANRGEAPAGGFHERFFVRNLTSGQVLTNVETLTPDSLAPAATLARTATVTTTNPGTYQIQITTDARNAFYEFDAVSHASAELNTAITNFVIAQVFNITVAANPPGAGLVTGGGNYLSGSLATVNALAITNELPYFFVNWTESGVFQSASTNYSFTATRSRALVANFSLPAYLLTASNNPPAGGVVAGQGSFFHGTTNVLTAVPNPGYRFTNWTENGVIVADTLTLTNLALSNRFVVANYYEANPFHVVTTATSPTNIATVSGAGSYTNGQSVVFSAPPSVTNPPSIYYFREFRLAGALVGTSPTFTKVFSTLDPTNLQYIAIYDTVSILPLVTNVVANLPNPVPATTNFQLSFQFNRSMNTNAAPLVVLSNRQTTVQITIASGGAWSATRTSNDTYTIPPVTFATGADGTNDVFLSLAQDLNGGAVALTNVAAIIVDVTPPPLPLLTLTSSNSSSVTVSWTGYAAPADVSAFRAFLRATNFSSITGLPIVAGLSPTARSYTFYGLALDTTYYLTVVPVDIAGNRVDAVTPMAVFLPSAVPTPVTISVTALDIDSANVNWSGYNTASQFGFAGFALYYETNDFTSVAGLTPRRTLSSGSRSAQVDGLDRRLTYYFAVVGYNGTNGFNPSVTTAAWRDPYAGNITANLTIGGAGQTVDVLQSMVVLNNAVLTIPAGTTLRFAPGTGLTIQQGRLNAIGTALDPIAFTSLNDTAGGTPAAGDWAGITLGAQAGASVLRHVFVEYGAGLTLDGCAPDVDAFTALYNQPAGLRLINGAALSAADALLSFNAIGASQADTSTLDLRYSVIKNNGTNALNTGGSPLAANFNWWGTANPAEIDASLVGNVNRTNFLTGEPLLTPALGTSNNVTQVGTSNVMLRLACRTADAMRISEDSAFFAVFYEPFAAVKSFPLSEGGGLKTIYAQFRSVTGQTSAPVAISITYITDGPVIHSFSLTEGMALNRPVTVSGTASAPLGMAAMEFSVDGQGVATNSGGTLSVRFDQRGYSNGIHRVKLLARDTAGRIATLERNVSISPTPPPAPVITLPATDLLVTSNTVNVAGTAEPLVDVRLLRNGAVAGTTTANAAGAWSLSLVSLVEGDNALVASAFDALGSASSPERLVVLDSGPPAAPILDPPVYRPGSGLEFAWRYAATGERPSRYRIFWHTAPFATPAQATGQTPLLSGPLLYLLTGLPAGSYYFGIVGYDDAGNASALSALVSYTYDPVPPAFNIAFNKASPVGVGPLRVSLTSSESLAATPTVTLNYGTGPISFTTSNTALNTYEGTLNVGVFTPSAPVSFRVSAQDLAGNVFNGAPAGPALVIDVAPPLGSITTVPVAPIQATNPNNVSVSLNLNEPVKPGTIPELAFTPPAGGAAVPIALSGSGQSWVGILTVLPSMGSGFGQFTLTAVDALDNVGHGITNGASLEIYNTASPSAPPAPTGLRAASLAGGYIRLDWNSVSNAEIYRLYTDEGTAGVPATLAADNIVPPYVTNLPAADGPWRFAVSASRRGSESSKSTAITAYSDRTPPPAPTNVTVQLVANGLRIAWQPGEGAAPARYNVYRNGALIRSVSGGTNIIDAPPRGVLAYTVGALDNLGNEALSLPAQYELYVSAVKNLEVVYNLDQAPILTWQPGDEVTVGYNVYRNGVKQNAAPLTSPTFTDNLGVQPGTTVTYAVKALNSTNAESAARSAQLHDVNFMIMANLFAGASSPLVMTYFDAYQVTVFNRANASPLPLGSVELRRVIPGQPTLTQRRDVHTQVAPGANLNCEIVFPGSTNAAAQSLLIRALQEEDEGGAKVYYQNPVDYVTVAEPGVMMEVAADQPPLAGGLATLNLRVFNRGYADVDLVVARGGGLQPGDLSVVVRNRLGQEVSRAEYAGMPPGSFLTPSGVGFLRIPPGGFKSFTVGNILVPDALGTNATTFEARFSNIYYRYGSPTQLVSGPIFGSMVSSLSLTPYYGTLTTDKTLYANDEAVQITGQAINRETGQPQPNVPLRIGFFTRGFKYYQSVTSDFSGAFTYTYSVPPGVSGVYKLWAAHPEVYDVLNQAEIKIYRAYLSPSAGDIRMTKNDTLSFNITLVNPGDEDLSGFTLQTEAWTMSGTNRVPNTNLTATVSLAPDFVIGPRENIRIPFNLTATLDAPDNAYVQFRLRSAEGATATFDANVTLLPANPLLTVTDPAAGYVDVSLNKGALLSRSVTIVNRGLRDLKGVTLEPPTNVTWMDVNIAPDADGKIHLPDMPVGYTSVVSVVFAPPADTPTAYYQDKMILRGTNTIAQFPVNLYALITSSSKGSVRFKVDNILVQPVPNATIRIKNTILQEEYTIKTDANGEALIENLQEGPWAWQILAAGHASEAGRVDVVANQTVLVEPRLSRSLVTVTFTVTPVPFTDRYEITIEQTFETHVPAPVLIMTPPNYDFFNVEAGFEATVIHNIKNHGLVKALDMQISGGADGYATTTPLINYVPELGAMQSIDVPFRFYYRGRGGTNASSGLAVHSRSKCEGSRAKCFGRDIDADGNITGGVEFPPGYGQPTPGDCTGGVFDVDNFCGALMAIANACAQCQDLKTLMWLATKGVQKYTEKAKFWNAIEGVVLIYRLLGCPTAPGGGGSFGGGGGGSSGGGGGGTRGYTDYGTGGGCFAAGTEVLLADGRLVPIEQIRTNDIVRTGPDPRERAKVIEVEERAAEALIEITLTDGRKLAATPEHQIWVDAKGWVFAKDISQGDWLFTAAATRIRVAGVTRVEQKTKVYTFTNREDHAFYANGVLVRDSCGDKTPFFRLPSPPPDPAWLPAGAGVSGKEAAQ